MNRPRPVAPPAVVRIVTRLEAAGFDTWAVGGALRDALLGHDVVDWDFATRARPETVQKLFSRTVPVGIDHGTVGVFDRGRLYEVTTFRRDVATDGRHAVVSYSDTIEEDLSRRDFTINAMAWHPLHDEWLDPFGGTEDLSRRVLRAVGSPGTRFREDRLRVLRGLRFAGRLGLEIAADTWTAMRDSSGFLGALSAERVREELMKVLCAARPSAALDLYRDSGALAALYPELTPARGVDDTSFARALSVVDAVRRSRPVARLSAFLRPAVEVGDAGVRGLSELVQRLRCSNAEQKCVLDWVGGLVGGVPEENAISRRQWVSRIGRGNLRGIANVWAGEARVSEDPGEIARVAERIRALRSEASSGAALTVAELDIDGNTLRESGLSPGPVFARILNELLARVLIDPSLNMGEKLLPLVPALASNDAEDPHE